MTHSQISMRKARRDDIGPIKRILFEAMHDFGISLPDDYSVSDIDAIGSGQADTHTEVLLRADCVIGFVMLKKITADRLELKRIYLTATERGKGLGKQLLQYAVDYAKTAAYRWIQLETTSRFKAAVSLYQTFGFVHHPAAETAPGHDLAFEKRLPTTRDESAFLNKEFR